MFSSKDIADYYDQTAIHYRFFWDLSECFALHYGIWTEGTRSFRESLRNTDRLMAEAVNIQETDHVLDAGCGIGGSALYVAGKYGCRVTGITLSQKQVAEANLLSKYAGLESITDFQAQDFCQTDFPEGHFDVVWALESSGSATDTQQFVREAFRLLKPGGRLVVADYFKTHDTPLEHQPIMQKWLNGWAISELETQESFTKTLEKGGFSTIHKTDYTREITPSAKRMYRRAKIGAIGSGLYNTFFKASRFSRYHYRTAFHQYEALKQGLWEYAMFYAKKGS